MSRYDNETISNSGLSALELSPRAYRAYKDKEIKVSQSFFDLGSAIHCRVLERDKFDERYQIINVTKPSDMYCKFIDVLVATHTEDCNKEGLAKSSWLTNAHAEAGFKWPLDKVLEKFHSDPNIKGYFDIKLEVKTTGKVVLSEDDRKAMDASIQCLETHSKACELLFGYALSNCENEMEVIWQHPDFPEFKMKSIFDRLIVDHFTKTVILVDLKTTSKFISGFKAAYKQYKYYRQMALYRQAVRWWMAQGILNYDIKIYIVATQTNGYGDVGVFSPSESDLLKGEREAVELLHRMKWHFDNDKWDYPMEYYTNDGVFNLNLDEE